MAPPASLPLKYTKATIKKRGKFVNVEKMEIYGFYQGLRPDSDWLPDFTRQNPFSSTLSRPVWRFQSSQYFRL
jgi:hypothetical protein